MTVLVTVEVFPAVSVYLYVRVYVHAMFGFTEPLVAVRRVPLPSIASVHLAPSSVYVHPNGREIVQEPIRVRTGGVVSTINIRDDAGLVLPDASVRVTVAVCVPSESGVVGVMFQFPDASTVPVRVCPSTTSVTVVPTSPVPVNVGVVSVRVLPLAGVRMVGVRGAVVSTTLTVRVTVAPVLDELSVTLYVTVYVPTIPVFTVLLVTILAVILPSSVSRAVAHASV